MTLIEIMISLTIITMMVGLVTGSLANYLRITAAAGNTVYVVSQHEKILREIRADLRQSSTNRSSLQKWWIEDAGVTLRLKKLVGFTLLTGGNPSLTWSDDIVYTLTADGKVIRQEGVAAPVGISGDVSQLLFEELANGRVRITLTNEYGDVNRNTRSSLTTAIEVTPQN
jgi:hypothetical protein